MNAFPEKTRSGLPSWPQLKKLPDVLSFKERYFILALGLLFIASAMGWAVSHWLFSYEAVPAAGGSYTEAVTGQPKFVNPLLAEPEGPDADLIALIYSGLVRPDGKSGFTEDLARSIEVSEDGLVYTVTLRDDVRWHDGSPFTADDVVFTINATQNGDNQSPLRSAWQDITIERIDDQRVRFLMPSPSTTFINTLTLGILPEHLWGRVAARNFSLTDLNLQPVGTGPFKFTSFQRDGTGFIKQFNLEAYDGYHRGSPYLEDLSLKFYANDREAIVAWNRNEVDGISTVQTNDLEFLEREGDLRIDNFALPRYFAVFLNQTQSKSLADKRVRLALTYATDKRSIIQRLLDGEAYPVQGPLPGNIFKSNLTTERFSYDPELARSVLDEGGWIDEDGDGVRERKLPPDSEPTPLFLTITTPERGVLPEVAQMLKNQWEQVGIRVDVLTVPLSTLQQTQLRNREYQALIFGQALGLKPDLYIFWHSSRKKDGLNFALYDNKDADALLEDIRTATNAASYEKSLDELVKLVIEDAPAIFLFSPAYLHPISIRIQGPRPSIIESSSQRFLDVQQWFIETKRARK